MKKTLEQELIDNYSKGMFEKYHGIITCGAKEMVRFINKIIKRKNRKKYY